MAREKKGALDLGAPIASKLPKNDDGSYMARTGSRPTAATKPGVTTDRAPKPGAGYTPMSDLRTTAQNFKARDDARAKIDPGSLANTPNNARLKERLKK